MAKPSAVARLVDLRPGHLIARGPIGGRASFPRQFAGSPVRAPSVALM